MSAEAATQFIQKIYEDEGLRNRLAVKFGDIAHTDLSDSASTGNTFASIGAEYGYNFDISDLQEAYRSILEQQSNTGYGELNENDLDSVAGGRASEKLCDNTLCGKTC